MRLLTPPFKRPGETGILKIESIQFMLHIRRSHDPGHIYAASCSFRLGKYRRLDESERGDWVTEWRDVSRGRIVAFAIIAIANASAFLWIPQKTMTGTRY
jgi:hypothetical protein